MLDVMAVQTALATRGLYHFKLDGISGRETRKAIDRLLTLPESKTRQDWAVWSDQRRLIAAQQIIIAGAGIEVGTIDGLIGEQTRFAFNAYDARLRGDKTVETWRNQDAGKPATLPNKSILWPKQSEMDSFFGPVGTQQTSLVLPYAMRIAWEPEQTVRKITCHEKVAAPLERIFKRALDHYGEGGIRELRLDMYGGCLNVRKMRGGSAMSMHSWGTAVDLDPDRNQLKWGRDLATLDDAPYAAFWNFVEAEGGVSLGRARNYDWMHFQFARL